MYSLSKMLIILVALTGLFSTQTSMALETIPEGMAVETIAGGQISIAQLASKVIVNWNSLNIAPGAAVSFDSGNVSWGTLNKVNGPTGYTLITGVVSAPRGGSIVLSNNSGVISQAGSTAFNIGSNFSVVAGTGSELLVSNVPEPSSYLMMLFGLASIGFVSRRKT